jgi:hypothetical protein
LIKRSCGQADDIVARVDQRGHEKRNTRDADDREFAIGKHFDVDVTREAPVMRGHLRFQPLLKVLDVEPQITRVAADVTDGEHMTGQISEPPVLDRGQIAGANPERARHVGELISDAFALLAELVPDTLCGQNGLRRQNGIVRRFAQARAQPVRFPDVGMRVSGGFQCVSHVLLAQHDV